MLVSIYKQIKDDGSIQSIYYLHSSLFSSNKSKKNYYESDLKANNCGILKQKIFGRFSLLCVTQQEDSVNRTKSEIIYS